MPNDPQTTNQTTSADYRPTWICRVHPTDWWHEVGCPHKQWTAEQLLDALIEKKRSFDQISLPRIVALETQLAEHARLTYDHAKIVEGQRDRTSSELTELRILLLSLAPLLDVKPNFQEVFIPRLNGGMAVCLSCGAFDDQIMIREHRSDCTSKAEFAALDRLRAAIEALRATPEPPQPAS